MDFIFNSHELAGLSVTQVRECDCELEEFHCWHFHLITLNFAKAQYVYIGAQRSGNRNLAWLMGYGTSERSNIICFFANLSAA